MTADRIDLISAAIEVPSNASRFMRTRDLALKETVSTVQLAWNVEDPYLYNASFDPDAIAHDESYCTSVVDLDKVVQLPTVEYFVDRVLPHVGGGRRVIDVGCGQGEFVEALRKQGVDAIGYDPVLREPSEHLRASYWSPGDEPADLFVLRCVLPHIPEPWAFIASIAESAPGALVLVEFQRLEWILDESIWYQISHDHVNLFSISDFQARYDVVDHDTFSNGEWGWALIRAANASAVSPRACEYAADLDRLFAARRSAIETASTLDRPIAIWGAAGKGIVLAHALQSAGADLMAAVDADPLRHGLFLEVTGLEVLSPAEALKSIPSDTVVLVCNPNHLDAIRERVGQTWRDLLVPGDLAARFRG